MIADMKSAKRDMWRRDEKHGSPSQAANFSTAVQDPFAKRLVVMSFASDSTASLVPDMPHSSIVWLTCGPVLPDTSRSLTEHFWASPKH